MCVVSRRADGQEDHQKPEGARADQTPGTRTIPLLSRHRREYSTGGDTRTSVTNGGPWEATRGSGSRSPRSETHSGRGLGSAPQSTSREPGRDQPVVGGQEPGQAEEDCRHQHDRPAARPRRRETKSRARRPPERPDGGTQPEHHRQAIRQQPCGRGGGDEHGHHEDVPTALSDTTIVSEIITSSRRFTQNTGTPMACAASRSKATSSSSLWNRTSSRSTRPPTTAESAMSRVGHAQDVAEQERGEVPRSSCASC